MAEFKGGIELISGLRPKNNGQFPLMQAQDVAFYEDGKEVRLTEKLELLKDEFTISDTVKQEIGEDAAEIVFKDARYTKLENKIGDIDKLNADINGAETGLKSRVETLESQTKGDNDKLKIQYEESESLLYLFEGESLEKPDPDNNIEGNVISTTVVKGGGGGGSALAYKLTLTSSDKDSANMFFADNENVVINFRGNLIDLNAEEDDNLMAATLTFKLTVEQANGAKKTVSFKEASNVDLSYDVTKLLGLGKNNISMSVYYSELLEGEEKPTTITARKTWGISIINLSLSINDFNYNNVKTKDVNISYTLKGDLNKTLYWSIDGGELQSKANISIFEYSDNLNIPMQTHGSHTVEIYAIGTKTGSTVNIETRPHEILDIMFAEEGNPNPVIRAVADVNASKQQYGLIPISYTIYQKDKDKVDITLTVKSNGVVESTSTRNVSTLTEYSWDYRPLTEGSKTLIIECDGVEKTLTLDIEKFPYAISPVETNLVFDFNPEGRTNEDSDFDIFEDRGIDWTVSENFDWNNGGWKTDAEGSSYFCIKAGTHININHNLFADEKTLGSSASQGNGKEFKVIFKTTNVADSRATWLSCIANTEKNKPTGIQMNIQKGYVYSDLNTLTIPYSEEDIIEFDMNIVPFGSANEKNIPMIMTYEDGTPVQPIVLTDETTSFTQASPVPITIGSTDCDVHLYRMKAYSTFLSDKQILDNFIADARSGTEKADRYLRNQIYDVISGKLSPEGLANACPDLRVITISAPRFTKGKPSGKWDKVKNSTINMFYKNGREVDNWEATGAMHTGQGTSSNAYGQAGRNLDISMKKKDGAVITIRDTGEVVEKVSLTENSIPVNYFNIKLNIASSENANNALLQKRFDRYMPYTPGSAVRNPNAKTTMEFFNCVVFVQETGTEEKVEFTDENFHFYGIGNIGDSKKTDDTRTSDPDDPNEFCVEIMDWNRALSSFPADTKVKASRYITKNDAGEITDYGFLVAENLGKTEESAEPKLYEKQDDGSYVLSQDEAIDTSNLDKYYVDILLNDDFSEDYTYGFRYIQDEWDEDDGPDYKEKNENFQRPLRQKWIDFYRFVTRDLTTNGVEDQAKIDQWKKEFSDWCIKDAAFYFYLFTLRYTMVDNRAKNTFWHYGKVATKDADGNLVYETDADGNFVYKFDFWDYDNDTALGIDNAGKLEMDYGVEDNDKDLAAGNDENSSPTYFRAANSTFFQRIMKYFADELPTKYAEYESAMSVMFDSEHFIKEFDEWQNQFPEELWRLDYERKYKRPYVNGSGENWDFAKPWDSYDRRYLTDMMNGKKKYQRRQFERNQDFYMSSKFRGAKNGKDMITLRGAGDLSGASLVVPQNATLHITPYLNMYINLSINNTGSFYYTQKCKAGEEVVIPYPSDKFEFNYIYGASRIQNLGDLSPMYLQTANLGPGEKLKEIILGNSTEGYVNNNIKDLNNSISDNNKLLTILNIENLTGVTGSLPVQNIPSIKEIYAKGSGVESVNFARNGLIQKAELPKSLTDLRLYDLYYLNDLEITNYNSLLVFAWENTPNINEQEILQKAENLIRVRVIDIDWTGDKKLANSGLLARLAKCSGINANNENTSTSVLTGRVQLDTIRESELTLFAELWPDLELIYNEDDIIPQYELRFWRDETDEAPIYTMLRDDMHGLTEADDPSQMLIEQGLLVKESTAQYDYEFSRWDKDLSGPVTTHMDFYAEFVPTLRKYTVSWYKDSASGIITNELGESATIEVEYGSSAEYDQDKFGIPSKNTAAADNKYHLFSHWDVPTGYVTQDLKVYPVWKSSTANISTSTPTLELKPEQINALASVSLENGLSRYIKDGDSINVQLGYMPDYNGVVLIDQDTEFNGTNIIKTDYRLFGSELNDSSFVLAIDFTMKFKSDGSPNILVSCGGSAANRGFIVYSNPVRNDSGNLIANSTPKLQWNQLPQVELSNSTVENPNGDSFKRHNREICVIRKVKGNPNLYVYTNNRFTLEEIKENILTSNAVNSINNQLCFGGQVTSTGTNSGYGVGTVHYAKLWLNDLGEEECRKICSWTHENLNFKCCATNLYKTPQYIDGELYESEYTTKMSFVADTLLSNPIAFNKEINTFKGGWNVSDLRAWLNTKVLCGLSMEWQQLLSPVVVKSLYGATNKTTSAEKNKIVNLTVDKLYIPAVAEIDASRAGDDTYGLEASQYKIYSPFDENAERAIKYPNGKMGRWWTRTPCKTDTTDIQITVDRQGTINENYVWDQDEYGTQENAFPQKNNSADFGVLLAFSIGG